VFKNKIVCYSILAVLLIVNSIWWSYVDRPHNVESTSPKLDCVSYSPYRRESTLDENKKYVSRETLEADLAIISKRFSCVRTYTSLYGMDLVPEVAEKYGMTVLLGVWINENLFENLTDLELAIKLSNKHSSVSHLIVGNESLFFSKITPKYLYIYMRYANKMTKTPISTGEIISTWIHEKRLAEHADFIAIHIFPFWNNVPLIHSLEYMVGEYE
jgi:exo-beta-1,3-glucanase (GH17 family)